MQSQGLYSALTAFRAGRDLECPSDDFIFYDFRTLDSNCNAWRDVTIIYYFHAMDIFTMGKNPMKILLSCKNIVVQSFIILHGRPLTENLLAFNGIYIFE